MIRLAPLACVLTLAGLPTVAETAKERFVTSNILATLYHELGHALIDIENVPIFGQEEDAADVLSILLIDRLYDEETAVAMAYDTAYGFWAEAERAREEGYETEYWGVHGPDEQRFYNTVCLFYGANPEERDDVAEELGLPEERAEFCPEEFEQAHSAWSSVLEPLEAAPPGETITFRKVGARYPELAELLEAEVRRLNQRFALSADLLVTLERCDEANAFYDPETIEIIMCGEYSDDLATLAP